MVPISVDFVSNQKLWQCSWLMYRIIYGYLNTLELKLHFKTNLPREMFEKRKELCNHCSSAFLQTYCIMTKALGAPEIRYRRRHRIQISFVGTSLTSRIWAPTQDMSAWIKVCCWLFICFNYSYPLPAPILFWPRVTLKVSF